MAVNLWISWTLQAACPPAEGNSTPSAPLSVNISSNSNSAPKKSPSISKDSVYKGLPFKEGEKATYLVSYIGGVDVGFVEFNILPPIEKSGNWFMAFGAAAYSGD